VPSSKKYLKNQNTGFNLIMDSGREYFIIADREFNKLLWKNLWKCIHIRGLVDYRDSSFQLEDFVPLKLSKARSTLNQVINLFRDPNECMAVVA
jgi:hypothetical protein